MVPFIFEDFRNFLLALTILEPEWFFGLSEVYLGGLTMITFVIAEEIVYDVTIRYLLINSKWK